MLKIAGRQKTEENEGDQSSASRPRINLAFLNGRQRLDNARRQTFDLSPNHRFTNWRLTQTVQVGKQADSVIARVPKQTLDYRDLTKSHLKKKVGLKVVVGWELAVLGGDEAGQVTRSRL